MIYRCRETYEHIVLTVLYMESQALKFELKAKRLLDAIDRKIEPECECGRCE